MIASSSMIPCRLGHYRMTDIHLSPAQWQYGVGVGRSRNRTNRMTGRIDMRVDSDGVGIDAQGAIGEVAVAIYSGMDYHEVRDKKPDQGADLIAPYGSVAVKCRDATKGYPADYLKAPHLPRNCSADFACLTWIINRTAYIIRLVGFLKYDDFNHLVKKASENGVYVPRDGWHVQWQAFCSTGVSE